MKRINPAKSVFIVFLSVIFLTQNSYSQQIVIDGNTATQLQVAGSVTDVTTSTIQGNTAFNSFKKFNVDQGNTVNLYVPNGAGNLLNLVHDQKTTINGVLNAFQNGTIGGNIYFANPYGIVIGASGVVNVGSLTAVTPTKEFMNGFFNASGSPSSTSVAQLLDGSVPINPLALISIKGQVNAAGDILISGGDVTHEGTIRAGVEAVNQFGQFVNLNGLQAGGQLVEENGIIRIIVADDVKIAGNINIDGADGVGAGNINVSAGGGVTVNKKAVISAKGQGNDSNGGNIIIWADHDSELDDQALLDVRGGDISGNGGFIEFSAKKTVDINGGEMLANATHGQHGSILLDPAILNLNSDDFTNGADKTFQADERINVNGVTISSRQVSGADHLNGDSIDDSGALFFQAPQIFVNPGSQILSYANNGFKRGGLSLEGTYEASGFSGNPIDLKVHVINSILKGSGVDVFTYANISNNALINNKSNIDVSAEVRISAGSVIEDVDRNLNVGSFINAETYLAGLQTEGIVDIFSRISAKTYIEDGAALIGERGVAVISEVRNRIYADVNNAENLFTLFSKAISESYAIVAKGAIIETPSDLQVHTKSSTNIDISLAHEKENLSNSSGVFVLSEVDSIAESYIGADLNLLGIALESISEIESNIKAATIINADLLILQNNSKNEKPSVSLMGAFSKHKNIAKAGFVDGATVIVDYLDAGIAAVDRSELSVDFGENKGNGLVIGVVQGDFQNGAFYVQKGANVIINEEGSVQTVSIAPESMISSFVLSQRFLMTYFGYQGFFSKLLSFQKKNIKSSSQLFSLSKAYESSSSSFSTSSQSSSFESFSSQK